MPRRKLVAANWKLDWPEGGVDAFFGGLPEDLGEAGCEATVCPSHLDLPAVLAAAKGTAVSVGAQNMHQSERGAYTGEVSVLQLVALGVDRVILGHSERRQYFNETDEALAQKLPLALEHKVDPILCVGESEAQREAEETEQVLRTQVEADLATVDDGSLGGLVIAYEPIWAIGTGKTATSEQAQEAIAFIRSLIAARDQGAAESIRVLYGGSVKPANAAELMAQPDIDGALVGGASLDPGDFAAILAATDEATS